MLTGAAPVYGCHQTCGLGVAVFMMYEEADGCVRFIVLELRGHQMIEIEYVG